MRYFTGISQETLRNNSICVKEGEYIRNIIDTHDVDTEQLVYVCDVQGFTIDPNKPVRYAVVNLSFRHG